MTLSEPNAYLKTKVMTASPADLRLMLLDGAIKFAQQGQKGLVEKNFEAVYNGITRCQKIILEMVNNLNAEADPELCTRLSGLYTFMYTRLIDASTEKDASIMDEVIKLLRFERETWQMLMDKLATENSNAAQIAFDPSSTPGTPEQANNGATHALVGGSISVEG
ncbi:MAG: flagellar export chaperone FliS [Planctomycetota bacterium]|nr:flagellar export chaperone FliS [Planctomycetota bacterium]